MKRVLFVCIENSFRSQMAEGFAKASGRNDLEIFSAGSKPSGRLDPVAIKLMDEVGIDISKQRSNGFFDLPYCDFDYVVTMGCKDTCPFVPGKETIDWDIEAPTGDDLVRLRKIRDKVRDQVKELLDRI